MDYVEEEDANNASQVLDTSQIEDHDNSTSKIMAIDQSHENNNNSILFHDNAHEEIKEYN